MIYGEIKMCLITVTLYQDSAYQGKVSFNDNSDIKTFESPFSVVRPTFPPIRLLPRDPLIVAIAHNLF